MRKKDIVALIQNEAEAYQEISARVEALEHRLKDIDMAEIAKDYANMAKNWAELRVDVDTLKRSRDTASIRLGQLDRYHDNNVSRIEQLEERCGDLGREFSAKAKMIDYLTEKIAEFDNRLSAIIETANTHEQHTENINHKRFLELEKRVKGLEKAIDRIENDGR